MLPERDRAPLSHGPADPRNHGSAEIPPALAIALDLRRVNGALERSVANGGGRFAAVGEARVLAARMGRRWTLRYDLSDDGYYLIGKVYVDARRGQYVHDAMRALWHAGVSGSPALRVPRPIAWLPELSMLVYEPIDGSPLTEHLERADLHPELMSRTAAWLAALHAAKLPLARVLRAKDEVRNVRRWAALVAGKHGALARRAEELSASLEPRLVSMAADEKSQVAIHKDFQPGHVLVGEDIGVIDLDEIRRGDPAFDVGHFCAYLHLLAHGDSGAAHRMLAARDRFLRDYRGGSTSVIDERRWAAAFAYACLKIASKLSKDAPAIAPGRAIQEPDIARMLDDGLSAITRGP